MFWNFGSLLQKHRESAGLRVVCVVIDQMVGDRRPPGRQYWGSRSCTSSANHRCQARRLVQNIVTHLGVDGVRVGKLSTSRRVPFLGFVLGFRFALPEALRRHFLRVSRQPYFRLCRCGDFGFVSRHKPAEHRIPDVSAAPTLRRHASRPVAAGVCLSQKDVAASLYVCSRGADDGFALSEAHFNTSFISVS